MRHHWLYIWEQRKMKGKPVDNLPSQQQQHLLQQQRELICMADITRIRVEQI
jgi:hypothetical protein